jgi:molybdate transport system ATP-binding protein
MQCLVKLKNAAVSRGGVRLVGPVFWRLLRGRHAAVIGENGAGKTTLLRLLRGEVLPDPGGSREYDFDGVPQASPLGLRVRMALVSADMQDFYFLHARRTLGRSVILSGFFDTPLLYDDPTPGQAALADEIVAGLGLGVLAGREVGSLSTGQLRMLLIARALAPGPDVLLLDECLEGLDSRARLEVLGLLDAAAQRSTLVCVAHRAEDVPSCVEHFTRLEGGRVAASGERGNVWPRDASQAAGATGPSATIASPRPADGGPASGSEFDSLLRMDSVSVVCDGARLVHDVSWEVLPGQCWAVVGPNGAGKSTLLRLILSEVAPYADDGGAGTIRRLGGATMDAARPRLGVVSPALQAAYARELGWEVTALETVLSGFRGSVGMLDEPTAAELLGAREWLDRVGLSDLAERPLRRLSYGQQRRVFLARAMAPAPVLLLLDEPFSGLDAPSRARMRQALQESAEAGLSFVMATHHAEDMIAAVNRVLALEAGRVAFMGSRDEYEARRQGGGDSAVAKDGVPG